MPDDDAIHAQCGNRLDDGEEGGSIGQDAVLRGAEIACDPDADEQAQPEPDELVTYQPERIERD